MSGSDVVDLHALDSHLAQQVEPLLRTVFVAVDHAPDAGLNDEFRTLDAGCGGDVECRAVAVVGAFGHLRDGVGFGVEHVGFGLAGFVLADVFEPGGSAVVTVRDDHLVLDDQRSHLAADSVGVLRPDARHTQVADVYKRQGVRWRNGN